MKYTPSELNEKIVSNSPSLQFQKEANLLVDFIINDSVCVYVRRIDSFMKEPTLGHPVSLSRREVFRLVERQKRREEVHNHPFVQRIFILILNNLQSNEQIVEELCAKCAGSDLSLLLCWNVCEAASLITEMKTYEKRGNNIIRKTIGSDLHSQAMNVLTSIDGINVRSVVESDVQKDNAALLMRKYATMADIMTAQLSDLEEIPGMGTHRVLNLFKAFQQVKEETE